MEKRLRGVHILIFVLTVVLGCACVVPSRANADTTGSTQTTDTFEAYYGRNTSDGSISTSYQGSYSLGYILNRYNVFTDGDYNGQHVVGPVIVGGDFKGYLGGLSYGDTAGAPHEVASYIGGAANIGGGDVNMYNDELSFYVGTTNQSKSFWVKGSDGTVRSDAYAVQYTDSFIDSSKMSKLTAEAAALGKVSDIIVVDPSITATLESDHYTYSAGTLQVQSGYSFDVSNVTISDLDVQGDSADDAILYSAASTFTIPAVTLNGTAPSGVELASAGSGIVFALPNATEVTSSSRSFTGHVVAPSAHVSITCGDYNGCVVASSVDSNGEGHMWPYNGTKLITPETPTEPTTPTEPETPTTPDTPETPTTPETPETPTTPDTPETPETPDTPTTPEAPVTPTEPATPITPETEIPETPATPTTDDTTPVTVVPVSETHATALPQTGDQTMMAISIAALVGVCLLGLALARSKRDASQQ